MRVVVVGGGSWGTAFACLAVETGPARLVLRNATAAERLRTERHNPRYLPWLEVPESVEVATLADPDALAGAELVVIAVPSRSTVDVVEALRARIPARAGVLSLTKGLDPATGGRLSERWHDALPGTPFCVLTGPNHAEEIAEGQPTAAVVAGDVDLAARVQERLTSERFRPYVNDDLLGTELCGAAKNVIAIAAGMTHGLGYGDNTLASLITRGLAEMARLGTACGARAETFHGLAGVGDLVATCTGRHSRNRRAGELLAAGMPADRIEGELGQVAEGIWTTSSLLAMAASVGVELPISAEVEEAIGGKPPLECVHALMTRAPRQWE
jgi:glycerol-3-phosphate dehydrogenase (NAD(P)+)